MEGNYTKFGDGEWGIHTGGHLTIGGDPGGVSTFPFNDLKGARRDSAYASPVGFVRQSRRSGVLSSSCKYR
jgi:hypothetical protein